MSQAKMHLERNIHKFFGSPVRHGFARDMFLSENRHGGGEVIENHRHELPYVSLVIGGGYREHVHPREYSCNAGTLIVHASGERHSNVFGRFGALIFGVAMGSWPAAQRSVYPRGSRESDMFFRLYSRFSAGAEVALMAESAIAEIVGTSSRMSTRKGRWLSVVIDALHERKSNVTLSDLGQMANRHPAHLARAFAAVMGCSIGEYRRALQLQDACAALLRGDPLADVAVMAGFYDQSHFCRWFRRRLATSPGEFQRTRASLTLRGRSHASPGRVAHPSPQA